MEGSILVSRSLAETRSAPAARISLVLRAQVCAQRCTQPGQTSLGRFSPSPFFDAPPEEVGVTLPTRAKISSPIWATRMSSSVLVTASYRQVSSPPRRADAEKKPDLELCALGSLRAPSGFPEQPTSKPCRFPSSPVRAQSKPRARRRIPLPNSASPRLGGMSQNTSPLFRSWSDETSRARYATCGLEYANEGLLRRSPVDGGPGAAGLLSRRPRGARPIGRPDRRRGSGERHARGSGAQSRGEDFHHLPH